MTQTNDATVTFRGFEGEPTHAHLSDYMLDDLGATLDSFLPTEPYHLDLKLHHTTLHNNRKQQRFECEAIVHIEGERNPLVICKSTESFYSAAQACEAALRRMLMQRSRMREKVRRQPRFAPAPAFE